ncbi:MAG: helix-turn-helix domain-containing protein [Geobacteraceae bacterium]|nr:helix-turn-helix domain-containing protein [Geobacteraceae bacterium]
MSESMLHGSGMQTAGLRLREAREQQGLTLDDAARVTRVSKAYLAAIEEGQHEKMPSEAYARGFLRNYARYLGFDEKEIEDLCAIAAPAQVSGQEEEPPPAETVKQPVFRGNVPWKWLIPSFVAVAAAALIFFAGNRSSVERTASVDKASSLKASSSSLPLQEALSSHTVSQLPPAPEKKSEKPFKSERSRERGAVLKLKALEDGALDVEIDDMGSHHYELKSGDLFEWKGERVFTLDLENAGGVEVELNGKVLEPLGERGEAAHVILRADTASAESAP